jgi:DNA-binding beta-propeller fold protein YncE
MSSASVMSPIARTLLAILLLLSVATPVAGETVVGSIPAPDYAGALTWDGSSLWCGMYGPSGSTVYELDPADGTVLSSFTGQGDDSYGLAWDGTALWQLDSYNYDMLFRMNTSGGLLDSIPSITTYMAGLTWDGSYLWCAAYYDPDGWIYQIDPATGLEVHSFDAPANQPWGLAFDGTDLWYVNDDFSGEEAIIYRLDTTDGTVLEQFDSPGANPRGLTWDGTYLWVCADNNAGAGRRCYQIDPGHLKYFRGYQAGYGFVQETVAGSQFEHRPLNKSRQGRGNGSVPVCIYLFEVWFFANNLRPDNTGLRRIRVKAAQSWMF